MVARAMTMATRAVCDKEGNSNSSKSDGDNLGNGDGDKAGG